MPSFDIVSRTDLAEVDNALNNMRREMDQRYDFKGSHCGIERVDDALSLDADDELKLKQMHELLRGHFTRRKLDANVLDFNEPEPAAGQSVRQNINIKQGIDRDVAKKIIQEIKSAKIKVQIAIHGDELRASGKKRDDLQAVIELIKGLGIDLPLKYINMRD